MAAFAPRYSAKGEATPTSRIADDLHELWADPERLGQVLGNLLDNALRHTRRGGCVTVTATVADDELAIAISDTGVGVAPEHLTRLFDRCYRADTARDRQHGGAGIGRSIAKALVEGLMTARSKPTVRDAEPAAPSASPCRAGSGLSTPADTDGHIDTPD